MVFKVWLLHDESNAANPEAYVESFLKTLFPEVSSLPRMFELQKLRIPSPDLKSLKPAADERAP